MQRSGDGGVKVRRWGCGGQGAPEATVRGSVFLRPMTSCWTLLSRQTFSSDSHLTEQSVVLSPVGSRWEGPSEGTHRP